MNKCLAAVILVLHFCAAAPLLQAEQTSAPVPQALPSATSKVPPTSVSTFHCLSLYWSPENGTAGKKVLVKYRTTAEPIWREGLAMRFNPVATPECKATYRGSLVNLQPGTTYEVVLTLEGTDIRTALTATTWSETFPVATTTKCESGATTLAVKNSGTPDGYILMDGRGCVLDCGNKSDYGILVDASYVILRGFTIKNVKQHGIRINSGHHIVIEDCDISQWGSEQERGYGFDSQACVYSNRKELHALVIQRCKFHHPSWDSNSWAEDHYKDHKSRHPDGPQTIVFYECEGNNVIRYNECWSDKDHYFNDVLGGAQNGGYRGFPGADSDIYGNYVANCWDDGIEAEGGGQNVRIWNNYIEDTMIPIANAAVSIGPLYVWRNVSGRSYSPPGSEWDLSHGPFMKMGYADGEKWMTGHMYIFNNTVLQTKDDGADALGGSSRIIKHCVTRNNIFQARTTDTHSISTEKNSVDNDFDFDLLSGRHPADGETNGIKGTARYVEGAGFSFEKKTGNFQLTPDSPGYDKGEVIANFCDVFQGARPDLGAHEAGTPALVYGVKAVFTPPGSAVPGAAGGKQASNSHSGQTAGAPTSPKAPEFGPERAPTIEKIRALAQTQLADLLVAHPGVTAILELADKPTEVTLAAATPTDGLVVKAYGASHKLAWPDLSASLLAGLIETLSTENDKGHAEHLCTAALLYLIDNNNLESATALNKMTNLDDNLSETFKTQANKLR